MSQMVSESVFLIIHEANLWSEFKVSLWSSGYFSEVKTCLGVECRSIFASRQNFATIDDDSFAVFGVKNPLIWNASKIDQLKVAKYALWRFRNDVPKIKYKNIPEISTVDYELPSPDGKSWTHSISWFMYLAFSVSFGPNSF